jgi:hypothetical protein
MGGSDVTEPLETYDEDVFVADLEDPAKKYAKLTKKAEPKMAAPIPEEDEYIPQPFVGSTLMWVGLVWVIIVVVIIIVSVASTRGDVVTPTMAPTMAPSVTIPDNVTEVPEETPTAAAPTVAPSTLANTTSPTTAPTVATPTLSPTANATVAPTLSPTANATVTPTLSPTVNATVAPTLSPTANATVVVTAAPSAASTTLAPTVAGVVNATDPPTNLTLLDLLPEFSQAALANPTSPQSFALLFVNYDSEVASRPPEEQVQAFALATQYFALGGRGWTNGSLTPPGAECEWYASTGSTCNTLGQQETLSLEMNNLKGGPIPPEIALLTALKVVDMSDNFIVGGIPTHFGLLPSLEVLSLARNSGLTGTVPTELASIPTLKTLDLSGLDLEGTIPEGLCGIPSLLFNCSADLCGCASCPCAST